MEWLSDGIIDLSHFTRDYLSLISLALVAVLLATVGKNIVSWNNRWTQRFPKALQLPFRSIFNLLFFGAIIYFSPSWLEQLLDLFNNITLAPVLVIMILLTGAVSGRYG